MRLGMLLTEHSDTSGYPPLYALMALLCLHAARFDARTDPNNALVILQEQDRNTWDAALIARGMQFLSLSATGGSATAYHLEAAIAAEHCLAPDFASTNWNLIHAYYTALVQLKPSSVIKLNLAIATGKKDGPHAAIALLHQLEQHKALENYYLLYASLGEFYCQIGDKNNATDYFLRAKNLARSAAIRDLLDRKLSTSQTANDPDTHS
jgi:RNA polymerase sigma-70 factor (ECF subfamily)